jgi:uncharacterized protein YjbI with pentapeptide repeats
MAEGKGTSKPKQEKETRQGKPWTLRELGGKTFWDWMQLLIVPVILSLITVVFTWQQAARQQVIEDQRAQQAQEIESQRAETERELAEQRVQDEALQAYLDQMSGLLLEEDLRASKEDSEVRTLARARTLTVLSRLDPGRKTAIIEFLGEAGLIQSQEIGSEEVIIKLSGSDLRGATLSASVTDLIGAELRDADLRDANLTGALMHRAFLWGANLSNANLLEAGLGDATLYDADLSDADLRSAHLQRANLDLADLSGADLSDADLSDANLIFTNLDKASGVTQKQLDQVATLEGATMPNGQKYEDWLKDNVGSGKKSGSS